ncbi:hypothetical protein ACCUM_2636 [Candidatus Accumulibacter phosphatis]|uniref:Uncharacterized protein n=2 Tax=Candidatus Accumulibacter phosphatis TaxID=327160 RepID=A0A5S4EHT5_9PROT|nr:hypothetical protein ACCUM_2636 [Candidatus Accumulibacter phosphatis]
MGSELGEGNSLAPKTNEIHIAACSLQAGCWSEYESQMKAAYRSSEDEIWAQLAKQHPKTVNVFVALSALSGREGSGACNWLLPVVGKLSHISLSDARQLLTFAETLTLSYRHMPAEQLKPHIAARPELGRKLGEFLRAEVSPGDASAFVWAGAFAAGAPKEAACYLETLLTGTPGDARLAAVLSTFLPPDNEEVQRTLASLESSLADAFVENATVLGSLAWAAMCHIADQSAKARSALSEALQAGSPEAIIAIANSLYRRDQTTVGVTGAPIEELVSILLQIGLADDRLRHRIDSAVDSLFYRPALRSVATRTVIELGAATNDVVKAFPEVFSALANHPAEFAGVLTNWLLRPDANFASLASLLSMCTCSRAPVVLDEATFAAQTPERRVKGARRLLALTHHGPTLCHFSELIAHMPMLGSERFNLSSQMLDNAFLEYPAATEEFLKNKTSTLSPSAPEAQVFQGVYANVLQWRSVLEKLPNRKELRPSDAELQVLRARKRRINREIIRVAAEQSIFASMCTNVHMAQGRKFASHTPLGAPQITQMAESSHFVELPSSEIADPMRGQIERSNLLRNAR